MNENELRDMLFDQHRETFSELIVKNKPPARLKAASFPSISDLLRQRTEAKINASLDDIELLHLDGKEVQLARSGDSTTRIDLLGHIEESGDLAIIELKKSGQTERQAFTELLAYANHFCTLFPPLSESSLRSILIAPMKGRGVRDAYAQELIVNDKDIVALIPEIKGSNVSLSPYYPSDFYYRWIENNVLDDRNFIVVTASFPLIEGWIDTGEPGGQPPEHTQNAFKIMTGLIAQKLEAHQLHGFVYARQLWSEICPALPNPNTIVLCLVSPFSPFRTTSENGTVFGDSDEQRLGDIQALIGQLTNNEFWLDNLHSAFMGQAIRIMQESFDEFFISDAGKKIRPEIGLPDWRGVKSSMIESATCHNMHIRLSGLLRVIFTEYIKHCYANGNDEIYYSDDMPMFSYKTYDNFLAVWEILSGLSVTGSDDEDD